MAELTVVLATILGGAAVAATEKSGGSCWNSWLKVAVAAAERSGGSCWNSGFEGGGGLFFSVFVSIPPLLLLRSTLSSFFFFLPPLFSPVFFSAAFDSFSLHSSFLSKITCGFLPFVLPFLSQQNNCLSLGLCLSPHSLTVSFFFLRPSSPVFCRFLSFGLLLWGHYL